LPGYWNQFFNGGMILSHNTGIEVYQVIDAEQPDWHPMTACRFREPVEQSDLRDLHGSLPFVAFQSRTQVTRQCSFGLAGVMTIRLPDNS